MQGIDEVWLAALTACVTMAVLPAPGCARSHEALETDSEVVSTTGGKGGGSASDGGNEALAGGGSASDGGNEALAGGGSVTDGGNEALAGGERDGGDTGTERVDGSAMPAEETPPHAEGSWRLVEYECENPAPDILDPFGMNICSREIGTVYEFDNGCLFGGEGCVSGLEYSATVPSSAGFPATEEVQEGAFDEENVEWHIRTKHMMMVCQNSIGRCLGMQEFLLFEEYLVLEPATG